MSKIIDSIKDFKDVMRLNFMTDKEEILKVINNLNIYSLSTYVYFIKKELVHNLIIDNFCNNLKLNKDNELDSMFNVVAYSTIINMLNNNNLSEKTFEKIISSNILFEVLRENSSFNHIFIELLYLIKDNKNLDKVDFDLVVDVFSKENIELILKNVNEMQNTAFNIIVDKNQLESIIDFYDNFIDNQKLMNINR